MTMCGSALKQHRMKSASETQTCLRRHWLRSTFLSPKIPHNVCHSATSKCCCSRGYFVMEKYNYMPVARQTLYSTVVSVIVMLWCECVHVHTAKREGERKIVDVCFFFYVERSLMCSCRWRGLKRGAFVLTMKGHKPFLWKIKAHILIGWWGESVPAEDTYEAINNGGFTTVFLKNISLFFSVWMLSMNWYHINQIHWMLNSSIVCNDCLGHLFSGMGSHYFGLTSGAQSWRYCKVLLVPAK